MLVHRMGSLPSYCWKEMNLLIEYGTQQYSKCPWCLPHSFCGELHSHHLCQIILIQIFFKHDLGNINLCYCPFNTSCSCRCFILLKNSEICPLVHAVSRQCHLEVTVLGRRGSSLHAFPVCNWSGLQGLAVFFIHYPWARKASKYSLS